MSGLLNDLLGGGTGDTHFKGAYLTLTALNTAHPTAEEGDYAFIDGGAGQNAVIHIWDTSDNQWVAADGGAITPEQIKQFYESNTNTNAFTDAEKVKLAGIEAGAEVNMTATEIATAYEGLADTNKYTDANKTAVSNLGTASTKSVGTLEQVEAKTANVLPDAIQLMTLLREHGYGTKWSELAQAVSYGFETMYGKDKYLVQRPLTAAEVALAPPPNAGRSFMEFNGYYIDINPISLPAGYIVKIKYLSTSAVLTTSVALTDGLTSGNRFAFVRETNGTITLRGAESLKIDGVSSGVDPADNLIHSLEAVSTGGSIGRIAATYLGSGIYQGVLYDLEVFNDQGERIHHFPLRTDAVDELAGNLVKDPEFTWEGNYELAGNVNIQNNSLVFPDGVGTNRVDYPITSAGAGTYRFICDSLVTSGSLTPYYVSPSSTTIPFGSGVISTTGVFDEVMVISESPLGFGFNEVNGNYIGSIKKFRVIKLNELSPSADFSSSAGFTLSGGVTITGGQAVFGAGTGAKYFNFPAPLTNGKKYRVAAKVNSGTVGSYKIGVFGSAIDDGVIRTANEDFNEIVDITTNNAVNIGIFTSNGWDGNVEYFSVTEVTDGTVNGSPTIVYEPDWSKLNA